VRLQQPRDRDRARRPAQPDQAHRRAAPSEARRQLYQTRKGPGLRQVSFRKCTPPRPAHAGWGGRRRKVAAQLIGRIRGGASLDCSDLSRIRERVDSRCSRSTITARGRRGSMPRRPRHPPTTAAGTPRARAPGGGPGGRAGGTRSRGPVPTHRAASRRVSQSGSERACAPSGYASPPPNAAGPQRQGPGARAGPARPPARRQARTPRDRVDERPRKEDPR
jgi:hypothetical protein